MKNYDFVIAGSGIIGLAIARSLVQKKAGNICILEKEPELGRHSSGRNSGVLHSGIYYEAGSLKAKLCASGAKRMWEYAKEMGIPVEKMGKVIVAPHPQTAFKVRELYDRAVANGVHVELVDAQRLREIEPQAISCGEAVYSPDTAVIDSKKTLWVLESELGGKKVEVRKSSEVVALDVGKRLAITPKEKYSYGHFINAAGLHADKIAHWEGLGKQYQILPFKGIYRKLAPEAARLFRGSIYPVPDLTVPFLGVHITRTIEDEVMVGPTAIPALGRENYGWFEGLSVRDCPGMLKDLMIMTAQNKDGFRKMVWEELIKYTTAGFLKSVRQLAPIIKKEDLLPAGKIGLRAQLVNKATMRLEMDFVVENGAHSTHILNAVSPAFTSSFAFADLVVSAILEK